MAGSRQLEIHRSWVGDRRGLFPDRADRSEANAEFKTMVSGRYLPGATAFLADCFPADADPWHK